MIRIALRGLASRRLRASLTALAVVLGVAMVGGTFVLTDSITKAFDTIYADALTGTDAVIQGKTAFATTETAAPSIPASLLERVRGLEETAVAEGEIGDLAKIIGEDGKPLPGFAPTIAIGANGSDRDQRFNPMTLTEGRFAETRHEVLIDTATAQAEGYELGDTVRIAGRGPVESFTLVGTGRFGNVESLGGARLVVFDLETAQELFGKEGRYDSIVVAGREGVTPAQLAAAIDPLLPDSAVVRTAEQQVEKSSADMREGLGFLRWFLLAFGAVALFVGSFIIFNTLSITVAQRVRELATMRTLGATRRQTLGSVLIEGLVLGAIATAVGLAAGVALAKGLQSAFAAIGVDMPHSGLVFAPRTAVVALSAGLLVTLAATLVPALRAMRVPPIAAVREGAVLQPSRLGRLAPLFATLALLGGGAALAYASFADGLATGQRFGLLGLGALTLFLGVAGISPLLVRPLAATVGTPWEWIAHASGKLARDNAVRNPSRTAITASALMVGLALVSFVAVLGSGMRATVDDALHEQVAADYVLGTSLGFDTMPRETAMQLASADGLGPVSAVRSGPARAFGSSIVLTGIDPETIGRFYRFPWTAGSSNASLSRMAFDGAIVTEWFAEDHGLGLGSAFTAQSPAGTMLNLRVRGIYDAPVAYELLGQVAVDQRVFDVAFPSPGDVYAFVDVVPGAEQRAERSIAAVLAAYPDTELRTFDEFVGIYLANIAMLLNLLYVLLALSIVVSLFGIVNTLVLAIVERRREIGMLRAVGMTRGQVARMIRLESAITASIGAVIGIAVGVALASLVTRALAEWELAFSVPVVTLVVFGVAAFLAGMLAAVLPARRAARLSPLEALRYE